MKILVVGGGGREHALCWALGKSHAQPTIFCAPGNAGIARAANCVEISPIDVRALADYAARNQIDLTVVGGETSLAAGIVDRFENSNLPIVGASLAASKLESSKIFAKDFMTRHRIATARYAAANSLDEADEALASGAFGTADSSVVVKADGLAAGKGVVVAADHREARRAIEELMSDRTGAATNRIVLEETLIGREVSLLLFADGKDYALMPAARDHKRIGENDTGANTGGMGTITDSSLLDDAQLEKIIKEIIEPTLTGAAAEGFAFRGVLFLGLMMTGDGAKLLEYNTRFGDPEAQAILVRLESDFVQVCQAVANRNLGQTKVEFSRESSACVVLAARNYPAQPEVGDVINGLDAAEQMPDTRIFHAGTRRDRAGNFLTAGGRVLGVTATGVNLPRALQSAYNAVDEIGWRGMQFRRDIGK